MIKLYEEGESAVSRVLSKAPPMREAADSSPPETLLGVDEAVGRIGERQGKRTSIEISGRGRVEESAEG